MSNLTHIYRKVNPKDFEITPEIIAQVAGIAVERIRAIVKKDYVILVHQWHALSLFVSYRKVQEWLEVMETSIRRCRTLEELLEWERLLRQEFRRFCYPLAWRDRLDAAWHQTHWQIIFSVVQTTGKRDRVFV